MKITLLLLLLFPLFGWGQVKTVAEYSDGRITVNKADTAVELISPVTIEVQYLKRDLPGLRDCYLINGEPWYRSTAPLTRGKWIKIRAYRWRISEGWNVTKNK